MAVRSSLLNSTALLDERRHFSTRGPEPTEGRPQARVPLAAPTPEQPHTWCALVNRAARDLSGQSGLVFSVKADGVYRFWVQVRDENPASHDGGTEVVSPLSGRPPSGAALLCPSAGCLPQPEHGWRLDLDRVRALVFVLDRGGVKVGTKGTIWIDALGTY